MRLHTYPDQILSSRTAPFPLDQLKGDAAAGWEKTFRDAEALCLRSHGYAIAAPQVGSTMSWFLVLKHRDLGTTRTEVYLNPVLLDASCDRHTMDEGCLSLPGLKLPVSRPKVITLGWTDNRGVSRQERLVGLHARVVLHEMDHIAGILALDRTDSLTRHRIRGALPAMQKGR